tara:strand:+ start:197 stop:361 length:165 start_codon:yes stop_codon:yes gene_type:complete
MQAHFKMANDVGLLIRRQGRARTAEGRMGMGIEALMTLCEEVGSQILYNLVRLI